LRQSTLTKKYIERAKSLGLESAWIQGLYIDFLFTSKIYKMKFLQPQKY